MHKFLITHKSGNPHTGPIMVTTSPRITCPEICPFKGGVCYAEKGFLGGFIWSGLDRTPAYRRFGNNIRVYSFQELISEIKKLPQDAMWRHNQAGDLIPSKPGVISYPHLMDIAEANDKRSGFTYTHYDPFIRENYHAILDATLRGFTINLSANDLEHADKLADLSLASVSVLLPKRTSGTLYTPKGRPVFMCSTMSAKNVTCKTCGVCARQHQAIVGLPQV